MDEQVPAGQTQVMTTIQDVARLAGVAPITVSRVFNNSGYVTEKVRNRVQDAIVALGYVPNTLARSLRSRRTNTLALVLSDITNPFFTTVARGVGDAAGDAGFMVIVCNTDEQEAEEQKYVHMLLQKRVDGVLLVPARSAADSLKWVEAQQTPAVILDRRVENAHADVVRCDSETGAYQLGRLLTDLGHRAIALLAGPVGVSTSDDRVTGFWRALEEAGASQESRVYHGEFTQQSGRSMTGLALSDATRPTALFAANNFIAIGALQGLRDLGCRVPEDVALVGFDDLPPALVTFPFLTVAAQPAYEMGVRAVELLVARLQSEAPGPFQEVVLPTELIIRQSSGGRRT
jgi:LacI family transcriptional regulator